MNEEVDIFPVVTRNEVNLKLSGNIKYMVHVYDMNGRLVNAMCDVSGFQQMHLGDLNCGLYVMTVTSMMGVRKVVKIEKE